jgi:fumarate hydratase class II
MENYRIERDSMGEMKVPAERYWGAQTQRSFQNFPIGWEKMPKEIIRAFAQLKKAAAQANRELKPEKMTEEKCAAICAACDEILDGKLLDEFPLAVWQTGSGTQSNMNVNEVIANRGNEIAGKKTPASERRCEYVTELQRHLPHRDAYCRGDRRVCRADPYDRSVDRHPRTS